MATHSVPRDHLLERQHQFERPKPEDVAECFRNVHQISEAQYQGDGSWGESPLGPNYTPMYRNTAWRIVGYVNALRVEDNDLYRQRMEEGAAYLLKEQQENGSYLWWCHETHGHPDTDHLLFCSANPGVALLEMYKLTDNEKYLDGSRRAADWAVGHPISPNNNYNSFSVWHLCELYKVTREEKYLESAIHKNKEGGFPRQEPNGAWAGHNAWIFYHAIIIRGFAAVYGVLPEGHEAKEELKPFTISAVNHLLEEQRENGHFRSCWDPEEWEKSRDPDSHYRHNKPDIYDPHALDALIRISDNTEFDVSNAIYGALGSPMPEGLDGQGKIKKTLEGEGMIQLSYGAGMRWLSEAE